MNASDDHLDWLGFFVFGVLLSAYGLYAITLPDLMPDHWDWLTSDENAVEYITGVFRIIGLNALGFGIFVSIASATAYRQGQRWAWFAFWYLPVFFALAIPFTWPRFFWAPFMVISLATLIGSYRRFFRESEGPRPETSHSTA